MSDNATPGLSAARADETLTERPGTNRRGGGLPGGECGVGSLAV